MTALLTKHEAATRARISLRMLERQLHDKTGPTVTRIGRRVLIDEGHLAEWIAKCAASSAKTEAA